MKLYLLRHHQRGNKPDFLTPLTESGEELSKCETCPQLLDCKITQIYSSPFYRVLQTLEPYLNVCSKNKVKIEYSLYEVIGSSMFNKDNYKYEIETEWVERFNIDESYESMFNKDELVYPETFDIINERVSKFIEWLYEKYGETEENILIATHQYIIHEIMKIKEMKIPKKGVMMGEIICV